MIVRRREKQNLFDCFQYDIEFILEDVRIYFYQSGNRDLNFTCSSKNIQKEIYLEIKKEEDYLLYEAFDKLYLKLTEDYYKSEENKGYQDKLFDGKIIVWKSDSPANEDSLLYEDKKYNYLNIYKDDEKYILKFINTLEKPYFSINLNTDRSRYGILVYPFMDLMNDLKEITEPYRQITINEYVYKKTLKNRR